MAVGGSGSVVDAGTAFGKYETACEQAGKQDIKIRPGMQAKNLKGIEK